MCFFDVFVGEGERSFLFFYHLDLPLYLKSFFNRFRKYMFYFSEKCHLNFGTDCIESVDCFGKYTHIINRFVLIQKHRISVLLFVHSSIYFINILISGYTSFIHLVTFTSSYFILFDTIVNGIVFFISS